MDYKSINVHQTYNRVVPGNPTRNFIWINSDSVPEIGGVRVNLDIGKLDRNRVRVVVGVFLLSILGVRVYKPKPCYLKFVT